MRWPWQRARREFQGVTPEGMIPPRLGTRRAGSVLVTGETALRHSAVWACLRLRADLISTLPVDTFRSVGDLTVSVPKAPVLVDPGGRHWPMHHWMWATQRDLDMAGNAIGLITEVNGYGLPARIDLQPIGACTVIQRKGMTEPLYKVDGKEYAAEKVWHERQYPVAGMPVGLSPVAFAAWTIGEYLSIQQFALDWFGGGAVPKARMRNKAKVLNPKDVTKAKQWYRDVISNGDLLVYGADWEYDMIQASQQGVEWLDAKRFGLADVCRFFSCPADLIEAAISAPGTLTYANLVQRNLQFLIMNLQPAITRREFTLSALLPLQRYVKLNVHALLRMDPQTQASVIHQRISDKTITVSEARALYDLPPLTPAQEAEFDRLFPPKVSTNPPLKVAGAPGPDEWRDDDFTRWLARDLAPRSPLPIGDGR